MQHWQMNKGIDCFVAVTLVVVPSEMTLPRVQRGLGWRRNTSGTYFFDPVCQGLVRLRRVGVIGKCLRKRI